MKQVFLVWYYGSFIWNFGIPYSLPNLMYLLLLTGYSGLAGEVTSVKNLRI